MDKLDPNHNAQLMAGLALVTGLALDPEVFGYVVGYTVCMAGLLSLIAAIAWEFYRFGRNILLLPDVGPLFGIRWIKIAQVMLFVLVTVFIGYVVSIK
jgi:hypothetical protein